MITSNLNMMQQSVHLLINSVSKLYMLHVPGLNISPQRNNAINVRILHTFPVWLMCLSLEVNGCKPKWTELFPPDHLPPLELFQVEDIPQKPVHKSGECLLIICSASSGMFLGFVSCMLSKFVVTAITVSRENPQIPLTSLLKITKTIPYTM